MKAVVLTVSGTEAEMVELLALAREYQKPEVGPPDCCAYHADLFGRTRRVLSALTQAAAEQP